MKKTMHFSLICNERGPCNLGHSLRVGKVRQGANWGTLTPPTTSQNIPYLAPHLGQARVEPPPPPVQNTPWCEKMARRALEKGLLWGKKRSLGPKTLQNG